MKEVIFDSPNISGMNEFLNYIYEIKKSNDIIITEDIVYHELFRFRLGTQNLEKNRKLINIESLFNSFESNYTKGNNSKEKYAFRGNSFLYFMNKYDKKKEFIKLYIPFDNENIKECVNILLDYLNKKDIHHCSKVCKNIRNDDFIIRLMANDLESFYKIADFINNNKKLKNGLLEVNPFLPSVNGIGYMKEKGISYNAEMSKYIAGFIESSYKNKNKVNLSSFIHYFDDKCEDEDIKKIFYSNFIEEELDKELDNNIDKKELLDTSIMITYKKYGLDQVIEAIISSINGNYTYFSRGDGKINHRNLLKEYLDGSRIKKYIGLTDIIDTDKIKRYCFSVLRDETAKEFDRICYVTASNYGELQTEKAIISVVNNNNYNYFSRFLSNGSDKTNYRELAKQYDKDSIMNIIKDSLKFDGIDLTRSDEDLIKYYSVKIQRLVNNSNREISR